MLIINPYCNYYTSRSNINHALSNISIPFSVVFHAFSNNFLQAGSILAASQNHATPADHELDEHIYDKEVDDGNGYLLEQVLS